MPNTRAHARAQLKDPILAVSQASAPKTQAKASSQLRPTTHDAIKDAILRATSQSQTHPLEVGASRAYKPLHAKLADLMRERIYNSTWRRGHKIPSEHDLMELFQVSRGTVRHAIHALIQEDLLVSFHGKGTFVAENGLSHPAGSRPLSFAESLKKQGKVFSTRVINQELLPAPSFVSEVLHVPLRAQMLFLRCTRLIDHKPILCHDAWLNSALFPNLVTAEYTHDSAFNIVERVTKRAIIRTNMRYSSRLCGSEHARFLEIDAAAPVLLLEQTIYLEGDIPIEQSLTWLPPGQSIVSEAYQI